MKKLLLGGAALVSLAACEDATGPRVARVPELAPAPAAVDASIASAEDASIAASPHLYAVVSLNGALASGNGVAGVTKLGPGMYEVTFTSNVSQCAYVATTANAYSQAIQAYTAGGHLSAQGVYVETKNQGGGLTDGPFHLVVSCGTAGIPFAVVGYSQNLVRSSAGVTMSWLGAGRYNVTFPNAVSACSFIATVADPTNQLVFAPSGVYTGTGPNTRTIYVETKNPGGGLQDGVPFHLIAVCPGVNKTRFAVVRADGTLVRGNNGTTASRTANGRFTVSHNRSLSGCATVGTRGSPNTSVPYTPTTVESAAGPNANSVGIQVRHLLFFGGKFASQAFHSATVCQT
jgi:hypothetical protein